MLMSQSKNMTELVKDNPTMQWAGGPNIMNVRELHGILAFVTFCSRSDSGGAPAPLKCDSYMRLGDVFSFPEYEVTGSLTAIPPCHEVKVTFGGVACGCFAGVAFGYIAFGIVFGGVVVGVVVGVTALLSGGGAIISDLLLLVFLSCHLPGPFLNGGADCFLSVLCAIEEVEIEQLTRKIGNRDFVETTRTCASLPL
ncbi:hypothetical protein OG21DRAFT_422701 [Imleria badia]|nr:hypothetical protein OG21DRAFT_422701 [Imleria badia]